MADYQAEIFASGNIYARIDPAWQGSCDSTHADLRGVQRGEEHMDLCLLARVCRHSSHLLATWNQIADERRSGRAQHPRAGWNRQEAMAPREIISADCLPAIGYLLPVPAHVDDSVLHACAPLFESGLAMALHAQ